MSEVITYGLAAIVILVLVLAIVLGLAKAGRARKATLKAQAKRGTEPTPTRPGQAQAVERENNLPGLKIRGTVKNGPKKKIGKIIDEHPDEAMSLIRRWMHGDGNHNIG